jgi:hypothetical protein
MTIVVADQTFKSKQSLLNRIREILYKYQMGDFVQEDDASFLTSCLNQANIYYGYPSETPIAWRVMAQPRWNGAEFVFLRPDGTRENPSIKRLSMTKSKEGKTPRMASRRDISEQILDFRATKFTASGLSCDEPGCEYTSPSTADFNVDHDSQTYVELYEAWLYQSGVDESKIKIIERRDEYGVMIDFGMAEPYKSSWAEFHKKHAKLQILCIKCHTYKTYGTRSHG